MSGNNSKVAESLDKTYICKLFNKGTCKSEKQSHVEKGSVPTLLWLLLYTFRQKIEHSHMTCHRLRNDQKNTSAQQWV